MNKEENESYDDLKAILKSEYKLDDEYVSKLLDMGSEYNVDCAYDMFSFCEHTVKLINRWNKKRDISKNNEILDNFIEEDSKL